MDDTRIIVLDLDPDSDLGRQLEEVLSPCYSVARIGARRGAQAGPGDGSFGAAFLASPSAADPRIEGAIRGLRETWGLPVLLAVEAREPRELEHLLEIGVVDFVTAPLRGADILPRLRRWIDPRGRRGGATWRRSEKPGMRRMIGDSEIFLAAIEKIPLMARCDATVLISGETGTGKEVCARAIHYLGPRAGRPFVPVNCGAIPLELIENELFGHERAAFTGAAGSRHGLIREAEGGTLFLDEVDALPSSAQVKLLRFLQEKEYRPLGSPRPRSADVRVVAATNTDVHKAVRRGELRQDLYYRLDVLPLALPPLRERREDILPLARHFMTEHAGRLGRPFPVLSPRTISALLAHDWPGNVRELEHVVERAVVLADRRSILRRKDVLLPPRGSRPAETFQQAKARTVAVFERTYIEGLLVAHQGNVTHAARTASKNRRAFWELMRKHHIDAQRFRARA